MTVDRHAKIVMTKTPEVDHSKSVSMLRLTAEHLKQIKLPQLVRPGLGHDVPPTIELIHWAIQAYSFPWIRHMSALIDGTVSLIDSDNKAAVRIIGRSSFEFCAHAYYVKKHVKQYLDAKNLDAAWTFLLPIGTGSRYINEFHSTPEESELFPVGPHISKAVNCFQKEVMPNEDDYSYLSEFCHPNMMTFSQHYEWTTPYTIDFVNQVEFGAFGAIAGSATQGLLTIHELLKLGHERQVNSAIVRLLTTIVDQHREDAV
jgi:hypothetical protein